ncbi:hypothetical protein Sjap_015460 [Stephania japonica]|uniref:Uncharacterized protein n=1 Tax=Stephania japonica TaxID=461633 RepID=A0AAP0NRD9_9MAGN
MGVPFLCMPYFADQFINMSYIVDVWRVGLELEKVTRVEIKRKVEQLIRDESLVGKLHKLKEVTMETTSRNGSSFKNFEKFANAVAVGDICRNMHRSTPAARGPSSFTLHLQARTSSGDKHR